MPNPFGFLKSTANSIFGLSSSSTTPAQPAPSAAAEATTTMSTTAPTHENPTTAGEAGYSFREVYDCAKLNHDWYKVSKALKVHPEWLTKIPEGRRWTMLHQIVFSGNVPHLNEVLSYQIDNPNFRLLCKTADDKTVREVATERAHINPQMIRAIERLVANDQLLSNAKDGKWDLVRQFLTQQPAVANEKPPYRRMYLAHYLAAAGALDIFKSLNDICPFRLDLLADNKTIGQVARENNHIEFAQYVENLQPTAPAAASGATSTGAGATSTGASSHSGKKPQYSPGFYDDLSISIIPPNIDFSTIQLPTFGGGFHHGHHAPAAPHSHYLTHSMYHGSTPAAHPSSASSASSSHGHKGASKPATSASSMTDEQTAAYEKKITSNVKNVTEQNLLKSITCCITKEILRDPVIAADGFTYEREAILEWFQHSNRSPMTNEELENTDLKPNYAVKSILDALHGADDQPEKSKKKDASGK